MASWPGFMRSTYCAMGLVGLFSGRGCWRSAAEGRIFSLCMILCQSFLQDRTEFLPEGRDFSARLHQLGRMSENALGEATANRIGLPDPVAAAHATRSAQVAESTMPFTKRRYCGKELFCVVHDEHAAH